MTAISWVRLRCTAPQYDQRKANTPIANSVIAVTAPTHWAVVEKIDRGVRGSDGEDDRQRDVDPDDRVAMLHGPRLRAALAVPTIGSSGQRRSPTPSAAPSRADSTS